MKLDGRSSMSGSVSDDMPAIVNAISVSKSFKVDSLVFGTANFRR